MGWDAVMGAEDGVPGCRGCGVMRLGLGSAVLWAGLGLALGAELKLELAQGTLVGKEEKLPTGEGVRAFLGVPFGEPTSGSGRFRPPKPLRRFPASPQPATRLAASCFGSIDDSFGNWTGSHMWNPKNPMSEDCLQLNLWTPLDATPEV